MTDTIKMPWEKMRNKVFVKRLARDDKRDFQIDIIKLEPNTTYTKHIHEDIEWVYVLKGNFTDEYGTFKEGDFKLNPKNSFHSIITGNAGCELITCWCGRLVGDTEVIKR